MADPVSVTISVLALAVSSVTAWLTLFRQGTVKMTRPTIIFFGPDTTRSRGEKPLPKVFLRTLLFATSKRGRVIESLHLALAHNETRQIFNIWAYGNEKLFPGSGLFVGETGIAANHHFLVPPNGGTFHFTEGRYRLEVFAHLLGDKDQTRLFSETLEISPEIAALLVRPDTGLYFNWEPDAARYSPHVESRPSLAGLEGDLESLGLIQQS